MELTFTFDDAKVQKKLSGMSRGFSDFKKPLDHLGDIFLDFYGITVFETQGGAIAEPWRALAMSTVRARQRRRGYYAKNPIRTDKILIWTGDLQHAMKKEVTPLKLRIYNDDPKFKYHQTPGKKPPQRRMLKLTSTNIETAVRVIHDYAQDVVKIV